MATSPTKQRSMRARSRTVAHVNLVARAPVSGSGSGNGGFSGAGASMGPTAVGSAGVIIMARTISSRRASTIDRNRLESVAGRATRLSSPSGGGSGGGDAVNRILQAHDDDDEFLHNLTVDGVKQGAYMICKHSDDLLGHHARQVFREKAASMRGENSIYYYLKELIKKFSAASRQQKKGVETAEYLVLDAPEFRRLIASEPAFQCAIPEEQVDALFHRIEYDEQKVIRHLDFVEFCLFDQNQLRLLLFQFRKCLKKLELSDNEIADTFKRLCSTGSLSMSPDLLRSAFTRELDVVLTTGEIAFLMLLLDFDEDSVVSENDFEIFLKDDSVSYDLVHPVSEQAVVDLRISTNEADEIDLRREGYAQMQPRLQEESDSSVYLWYRTASREEGKAAINNIRYAPTSRDTELVAKGFTCLQQDINRSGAFGKHKYIWFSFIPTCAQGMNEVVDLCLSSGDRDDSKDARLWMPMHRGFKLVHGNLNGKSTKRGVFLWLRRRQHHSSVDVLDSRTYTTVESPGSRLKNRKHIDGVEDHVRATLRRQCPVEQDGSLNFGRLFEEFDHKKARAISKQATLAGIEAFGIKVNAKDSPLLWERINPNATKSIDVEMFSQYLEMSDSEIDGVIHALQRSMTTQLSKKMPNYRAIFQSYNALGDGRLSRSDFLRLFACIQINLTNSELSKVIQRFDIDKDGVVNYTDFLRYITGVCDSAARIAQRVADAADEIKTWALEKQNRKLAKDGNIDSTAAWKLLRPKRGVVDVGAIDHVLRQRNVRLNTMQIRLVKTLVAPATNGEISQTAFHAFVNHLPRKLSSMIYDAKKILGPTPAEGGMDAMYDRLNVEGNGKLSLVTFSRELNALAAEKGVGPMDLKDLVYLVQWTGADCGGDGAVLIDRFIASVRDNRERRNMKHEFVTNYDSPKFVEGVCLLREEMRRCAKTPDGVFNYMTPFRLFDKDDSGQIMLSEFDAAVRELGVDKYLTDQEIKSLMRRFDLNSSGGIDYEEFLRFNLSDSSTYTSQTSTASPLVGSLLREADQVLEGIVVHERLTPTSVEAYCNSLRRMFGIIDQETIGLIPAERFTETLRDMGIHSPHEDIDKLIAAFTGTDGGNEVYYDLFCEALQRVCKHCGGMTGGAMQIPIPPIEAMDLLRGMYREYQDAKTRAEASGRHEINIHKAFAVEKGEKRCSFLSVDEFKEILWAVQVRHPYLREELESILACFRVQGEVDGFNVGAFCEYMEGGASALFGDSMGFLDGYIIRLQDEIRSFLSAGKDTEEKFQACFREFDTDEDGVITSDEFNTVLQRTGLHHILSPDEESLLLHFLDTNGDGVVSCNEFMAFLKHADQRLNAAAKQDASTEGNETTPLDCESKPTNTTSASPVKENEVTPATTATPNPGASLLAAGIARQVWRLNKKLNPRFPFDKYFKKYEFTGPGDAPVVKTRVFGKIMDKFLTRLVEHRVAYDMQELDADQLTHAYTSQSGPSVIHFNAFLDDLQQASLARTSPQAGPSSDQSSSSDSDVDVSCSSDEEEYAKKKATRIGPMIRGAIVRYHKTASEQDIARTRLSDMLANISARKKEKARDKKVYAIMAGIGIRLTKSEAQALVSCIASTNSQGRAVYDLTRLGALVSEQFDVLLGRGAAAPDKVEPNASLKVDTPAPTKMSGMLADKILRCFMNAAQKNVSGRKLLEKCDPTRTGAITLLEFQTVMRLMGCMLSDCDISEVISTCKGEKSGVISYVKLVHDITNHHNLNSQTPQPLQTSAFLPQPFDTHYAKPSTVDTSVNYNRPPPIQAQVYTPSPVPLAYSPHKKQQPPTSLVAPAVPAQRITSADERARIDKLVIQPYFNKLLGARVMSLMPAFKPYDVKSSGFVSSDGFHAVMRKLDITLPDDMALAVFARFASMVSDNVDYVEFCTVVCGGLPQAASLPADISNRKQSQNSSDSYEMSSGRPFSLSTPSKISNERCATFSLPSLELDMSYKASNPEPHRMAPSASIPVARHVAGPGWSCPVCFHTQTSVTSSCEICAAQNPASVQYETLRQCAACAYRNRSTATHCELCRLSLDLPPTTKHRSHPPDPHTSHIGSSSFPSHSDSPDKISSRGPAYDEGWLT